MKNKKAMEMKIAMSWLFVLIVLAIVLFFIKKIGSESNGILDILGGLF